MRLSGICTFVAVILSGIAIAAADEYIRSVPIKFNDPWSTEFVLPGDRVDVMLTRDSQSEILLQNVEILAIDPSGSYAVLQVIGVENQKLIRAKTDGDFSLVLRSCGHGHIAASPLVRCASLLASDLCLYRSPVVASQP